MAESKLVKSPTLGIIFQLTEVEAEGGQRRWEVHDVERGRGFRVRLVEPVAPGATPQSIEQAILVSLERELQTPPQKVSGEVYDVELAGADVAPAGR